MAMGYRASPKMPGYTKRQPERVSRRKTLYIWIQEVDAGDDAHINHVPRQLWYPGATGACALAPERSQSHRMNRVHALKAQISLPKRAKPPERLTPDARRRAIMDAAKDLFLTRGYAATSLEEVVATSGGSLATLYQLFGNKQGLWEALVAEVTEMLTAPLLDAMIHHGNPRAVLKEFAQRLDALERSGECSGAFRLMLTEGAKYPELAKTLFAKGPDASRAVVAAYLDSEVAAGSLAITDTTLATEQFCSLVCNDLALRNACGVLVSVTPAEIEQRLDAAVDMFLKAYSI